MNKPSDIIREIWVLDIDEGLGNRTQEFLNFCDNFFRLNTENLKEYNRLVSNNSKTRLKISKLEHKIKRELSLLEEDQEYINKTMKKIREDCLKYL
jgi:hypothetical protein